MKHRAILVLVPTLALLAGLALYFRESPSSGQPVQKNRIASAHHTEMPPSRSAKTEAWAVSILPPASVPDIPREKAIRNQKRQEHVRKVQGMTRKDSEDVRRGIWLDRQQRRNALRVQIMAEQFHLSSESVISLAAAFETALTDKVALYDSLPLARLNRDKLTSALGAIRAELRRQLTAVLGKKNYGRYLEMENAGRFVLPDEKKKI